MLTRLVVAAALILGGCSGKSESPGTASTETLGFPFVPDPIANQLGGANVIIAINLGEFGLARFEPMIPDMLGCVKELLGKVGIAVIASAETSTHGFVSGMPEAATKKCVGALAPLLGVKTEDVKGAFQLALGDDKYQMVWKDGVVSIKDLANPPKGGAPDQRMRGLVAQVPKDAVGWIVSGGFPKYKITQSVAWLKSTPQTWHLEVTAESNEPGVAKEWVSGIIKGFREGAARKGVTVEDSWFKVTETGNSAKLVGDIPDDIFTRVEQ
jgi:hypothetical protein